MMRRLLFLCLASLFLLGAVPFKPLGTPIATVTELFPVEPGVNAGRGFAVAVSGDWLAMGARLDDQADENAGAVYVFHWSGSWEQTAKLYATTPVKNAQFGFSVAMHGGVLAVSALGERAVYIFEESDGSWVERARWPEAGPGPTGFGKALALGDGELAVAAGDGRGLLPGTVHLLKGPSWTPAEQVVQPGLPQAGERFGHAVSMVGGIMVVGAPGYDLASDNQDAGAAYVFERQAGAAVWQEKRLLRAQDSGSPLSWNQAGSQFGFAVAVALATNGPQIIIGSPTADPDPDGENSGALYRFLRSGEDWIGGLLEAEVSPGVQLGFSVAAAGDLIAAGSPAPPPAEKKGSVHVFRRTDGLEVEQLSPGNAESRDLAGFAVAVDDERVAVGGVFGDQGGGAAGNAWSFRCLPLQACAEEAEAMARDVGGEFGSSVALTELSGDAGLPEAFVAVGSPRDDGPSRGAVYVYRRAGQDWRQETRLAAAYPVDGFGSAVALSGPLLAGSSPVSGPFPNGYGDLFARIRNSWVYQVTFLTYNPDPEEAFGTAVSLGEDVLAVGAPRGSHPGVVYVFEKGPNGWSQVTLLTAPVEPPTNAFSTTAFVVTMGDEFGAAVSLQGDVLAIGAPGTNGDAGAVYVSVRGAAGWSPPQRLPIFPTQGDRLGASVAAGDNTIAAGAPGRHSPPGGSGAVHLFERIYGDWQAGQTFEPDSASGEFNQKPFQFGASVALLGNRLVVGAPDKGTFGGDPDRIFLFERQGALWTKTLEADALNPPVGDRFGTAVALSKSFLAVTSPGPVRSARVTVFEFVPPQAEGETP